MEKQNNLPYLSISINRIIVCTFTTERAIYNKKQLFDFFSDNTFLYYRNNNMIELIKKKIYIPIYCSLGINWFSKNNLYCSYLLLGTFGNVWPLDNFIFTSMASYFRSSKTQVYFFSFLTHFFIKFPFEYFSLLFYSVM